MNGLEAVLAIIGGIAFVTVIALWSLAGNDLLWRRAVIRRERLHAEIELQRLTHQAVLRMLSAARKQQRHTE